LRKKGKPGKIQTEENEFLENEIKDDIKIGLYRTLEWLLDEVCNLNFKN
jgi:hypothetical protein